MSHPLSNTAIRLSLLASILYLSACGGGSDAQVQETPVPPPSNAPDSGYDGPPPATTDVQDFKLNVWDNLATQDKCAACHVQGEQSPAFARNDDINDAYAITNTLVDKNNVANSLLITKVAGGHNCWLSSNSACADIMTTWIEAWLDKDQSATAITLEAPAPRAVGANKNFPDSPALFESTVYPLLETYCSECHQSSASIPISPYIGSSDVAEAYLASISKINLDLPKDSRMVERVRDEFHNCWDDCASDAIALTDAIEAMSESIEVTQLDSNLVASNAVGLFEGTLASGGGRFESNLIAKWEFKTGSGNTAFDTSGVSPAIDLTLSGNYNWVGGWGIQLNEGKAQGATSTSKKLHDLIVSTGEFAIEVWVAPANVTQEGPARIISYSGGDDRRNFMLGQTLYNYNALVRNDNTDSNGEPALNTADADEDLQAALQHVVLNYSGSEGRTLFVNGQETGDSDTIEASLLNTWDDTFAFVIGSEVSGRSPFAGTVRMVAIHNRALSSEQVASNFDAGIGQKFYLMFGIGEVINQADTYVVFEVSQFDSYSYLFTEPFVVSLNQNANLDGITLRGMRIGINGREERTGQVFATLDMAVDGASNNALGGKPLSPQGTIIPVEKGPELDEFFLTFDVLGDAQSVRIAQEAPIATPAQDIEAQAQIGVRNFDEINASMAALTGVSITEPGVQASYQQLRQQLPSVSNIDSFLTSNQMAITQLAIKYCDALVEDSTLRSSFFPNMDFNANANNGFNSAMKDAIINPLNQTMLGNGVSTQPEQNEVYNEVSQLIDRLSSCANQNTCQADTTKTVVKASCAALLGSAVVILQ
ncbi:LamG domain-containing protein [Glaciecola siphonariae]|uniref:LamG domain-containing protein n=1 Tax=Glaciecola siphonariae TaxID=521012 RepID=A0ABV9LR63_9ALTE